MYDVTLALGVFIFLAVGLAYINLPQASLYHPGTWILVYHGLFFTFRPLLANYYNFEGIYALYSFYPSPSEKILALFVSYLSFVVMMVTAIYAGRYPWIILKKKNISDEYKGRLSTVLLTIMVLAPIATYSLVDQIISPYAETAIHIAGTGQNVNPASNGYFQVAQAMLVTLLVMLTWSTRFRLYTILLVVGYIAVKSATGSRWPLVVIFIWIALLHNFTKRRRWPSAILIAPLAALGMLFSLLGADRGDAIRQWLFGFESSGRYSSSYDTLKPFETMDYGNMEFLEYIVHVVPERSGTFDYYTSNSRILTEPIPRVLWPEKPVGAPYSLVDLWRYGTPIGMTNSVAGTGWLDFGWIGVILWSALFGTVYGKMYQNFALKRSNFYTTIFYTGVLALSLQFFRDGVLLTIIKFLSVLVIPLWVWKFFDSQGQGRNQHKPRRQSRTALAPKIRARQQRTRLPAK